VQTADTIENSPGAGQPWLQQPVQELRTRCLPVAPAHSCGNYDANDGIYR